MEINPIAHIENGFHEKFGIPRQSGILREFESLIVFEKEYRNPDALRGLEGFSHLWLIWCFTESIRDKWKPTVRPPRLGGNKKAGVFATRSPFRPNPLGLSSVELKEILPTERGNVLVVRGADLIDGTPIFDIKPYLSFTDSHPEAKCGFAEAVAEKTLSVDLGDCEERIPEEYRKTIAAVLSEDPRPSYQNDGREYTFDYRGLSVTFTVNKDVATVIKVE